jgi:hypothetical protein
LVLVATACRSLTGAAAPESVDLAGHQVGP